MGAQKNRSKGDGPHEHPWHNKKIDSESDNLEKWHYPSFQTALGGAQKNRTTGAIPLHPQHVLNHKFIWKPNYNYLNN